MYKILLNQTILQVPIMMLTQLLNEYECNNILIITTLRERKKIQFK